MESITRKAQALRQRWEIARIVAKAEKQVKESEKLLKEGKVQRKTLEDWHRGE